MNNNTFSIIKESELQQHADLTEQIKDLTAKLKDTEKSITSQLNNGAVPAKNSAFKAFIKDTIKNTVSYKDLFFIHVPRAQTIVESEKTSKLSQKLIVTLK